MTWLIRASALLCAAGLLLCGQSLPPASTPVAAVTAPIPAHVYAVEALNMRQQVAISFHRGDKVALRIRWQVVIAPPKTQEDVFWVVYFGQQAIYRHYRQTLARLGKWKWTTTAQIPRTATPGAYIFQGKVVIAGKQSWRVFSFRVVR